MNMLAPESSTLCDLFWRRVDISRDVETYRVRNKNGEWTSTTWGEFSNDVQTLAAGLQELGIGTSDTVAILADTVPAWCCIDLATMMLGAMNLGIYQTLLADQVSFILADSGTKVLFVQGQEYFERIAPLLDEVGCLEHIVVWDHTPGAQAGVVQMADLVARGAAALGEDGDRIRRASENVSPTAAALTVYTSGTTGRPKGVPLTHQNILSSLRAGEGMVEEITAEDITISFLPMAHVAEHVPGFFGRINIGLATAYATNYDTLLDELEEIRPTYFGAVPRIFEKMYGRIHEEVAKANPRRQAIFGWAKGLALEKTRSEMGGSPMPLHRRLQWNLADKLVYTRIRAVFGGRVKVFVTGSAPIQLEILEFFFGMGLVIIEVYGLSEATAISFANRLDNIRLGTVGQAIPGVTVKVAEDGEILLKGPTVFAGYHNLPQENSDLFDEDGYLRTGDIGELDADGFLRITDRKKSLIKSAGGKYVVPARLEALVKEEPLVSQVYVHGDRKPYVVALLTLDEREAPRVAEELGCSEDDLPSHPSVLARMETAIEKTNARLARFEQIKRHAILPRDFSIEEATLTPTMKLRRKEIASLYADQIEALYEAPRV
jgi:long-chain acyl-CoA synthetase